MTVSRGGFSGTSRRDEAASTALEGIAAAVVSMAEGSMSTQARSGQDTHAGIRIRSLWRENCEDNASELAETPIHKGMNNEWPLKIGSSVRKDLRVLSLSLSLPLLPRPQTSANEIPIDVLYYIQNFWGLLRPAL